MSYVVYNPNPLGLSVGDCVIRAISKITGLSWKQTYIELMVLGYAMGDMPSANRVWSQYLENIGYEKKLLPKNCSNCYRVKDFCYNNPKGKFVVATGDHVVAVVNGDYYDSWNSGNELLSYYFERR